MQTIHIINYHFFSESVPHDSAFLFLSATEYRGRDSVKKWMNKQLYHNIKSSLSGAFYIFMESTSCCLCNFLAIAQFNYLTLFEFFLPIFLVAISDIIKIRRHSLQITGTLISANIAYTML